MGTVGFGDVVTPGTGVYDPAIRFCNNSANRISLIGVDLMGGSWFDRVQISLDGSGAVDNVRANVVPLPTSALAGVILLTGASAARVRRRRRFVD